MGGQSLNETSYIVTGNASTASTGIYWKFGGYLLDQTAASNSEIIIRNAGVFSKLLIKLIANSLSAPGTNLNFRINSTSGNQIIFISNSATGTLEDTTHTDTVAAADQLTYRTDQGTGPITGTVTPATISSVFTADTDTVSLWICSGSFTGASAASTTYYLHPSGRSGTQATEAGCKFRVRKAGTAAKFQVMIDSNNRTTNTVHRTRKNGANGGQSVTYGSGVNGALEDTSNSDTLAVGDDFNYSITNGTGTQTFNHRLAKTEFVSTAGDSISIASDAVNVTQNDALTRYYPVQGRMGAAATTEADAQIKTRFDCTASELNMLVITNTVNATSTIKFRKGSANGNQTVNITTNATGLFNDTTNTDTIDDQDAIDFQLITASVSGTQTITFSWMSVVFNVTTTTPVNQTYTHLYKLRQLATQTRTHIYKIIGRAAQTYTHKYKIRALVNATKTHIYKIRSLVNRTRTHIYKVVGRVAKTYTHLYKIIGRVVQTYTHKYNIKLLVSRTRTHIYKIVGRVAKTYTHLYKIRALVNRTRTHIYKIVGRASQVFTHLYKIRQLASQTYTHLYKIRSIVNRTRTHIYKIVGRATKTVTHLYKIRLLVNQTYTHKYKIRQLATQIRTHIYKIIGRASQTYTHKYRILILATQTFTHKYKLRQLAIQTFTHIYKIISEQLVANREFTHIYKIVGRINQTYTHKYNIKLLVNKTFTHIYKLRLLVSLTRTFLYKIRQLTSQTYTHKYKLTQLVNATKTFLYKIIGRTSQTYTHKYKLRQLVNQIKTFKYNILVLVNQSYTHLYKIRALVSQTFTHSYNILELVSNTFTYIYKIFSNLVQVNQTFTHIYRIRSLPDLIPLYLQSTVRKIESGFDAFAWRDRFRSSESYVRQMGNKAVRKYLIRSRRAG